MSLNSTKKGIVKLFVILVLVGFLLFTALSAVMYLTGPKEDKNIEAMITQCEDNGLLRDEELGQCLEEQEVVINSKEACDEKGGIWYAENEICIE